MQAMPALLEEAVADRLRDVVEASGGSTCRFDVDVGLRRRGARRRAKRHEGADAGDAHAALHETAAGAGSGRTTTVSTTGMTSSAGIGTVAAWARMASGLSPS